jgi:hypothetical protein
MLCSSSVALCVNSNSIIVDSLRYRTQTDKALYYHGEVAQLRFVFTNLRPQPVDVGIGCSPVNARFEVKEASADTAIWKQGCAHLIHWETVAPGDSLVEEGVENGDEWDLTNSYTGTLVEPGFYDVTGYIPTWLPEFKHPVAVQVEVRSISTGIHDPAEPALWSELKSLFR